MKEANIDAHAPNKNDPRINKPIKIDMDKNRINICFFLSETDKFSDFDGIRFWYKGFIEFESFFLRINLEP